MKIGLAKVMVQKLEPHKTGKIMSGVQATFPLACVSHRLLAPLLALPRAKKHFMLLWSQRQGKNYTRLVVRNWTGFQNLDSNFALD